ncbi:LIMR family protein [Hibiscus syriacus]|uniref:LIMR family protein n=1 Tax=Hibiscus syriacus TaxID=106335 RepID=A0A6A3BU21_HIBSY|nr:LIMR family protein [Hibiscus syriacus]
MGDFNLALVIVAVIVCVLVLLFNLLINYQHSYDANQAYFPKFVVVFGLFIAGISILMLPADVANRQACRHAIYNGACNLTLPMKELWLAVYIIDAVLVFFVIPFAMFYYEGDQDKCVLEYGETDKERVDMGCDNGNCLCSLAWNSIWHLSSATTDFTSNWDFSSGQPCIGGSGAHACSAYTANASSEKTWTMCTTFPEYVVALATIVGSVLFSIFGGVGIASLPLGLIAAFIHRPKAVITRSQYIKEATELGKRAGEVKKAADDLRQEEKSGSKGRKWRKNVKAVEKELLQLEEDVKLLEEMYPQGEKAETSWALTVLGYLAKLVLGILGSSGYCCICILLLLPSACCDCWCNDAWSEISFHYNSPYEVGSYFNELFSVQCGTYSFVLNKMKHALTFFGLFALQSSNKLLVPASCIPRPDAVLVSEIVRDGEEKNLAASSNFPRKNVFPRRQCSSNLSNQNPMLFDSIPECACFMLGCLPLRKV